MSCCYSSFEFIEEQKIGPSTIVYCILPSNHTKMPIYFYSSLHNLATEIFTKIFPFYETIKWPD